jgi:SAM-dependent methyltransferase
MEGSINFDRAASFYDKTRALAPGAYETILGLLKDGLEGRGPALEIGVGTGRFAVPLARMGFDITGIDLSEAMLKQLIVNSNGEDLVRLARADATKLPFPDDTFGASLTFWVFHLIPDWRHAADELVRVVRPDGALIVEIGGWDAALRLDTMFCVFAGIEPRHLGLNDIGDLDDHLGTHGFVRRDLDEVHDKDTGTIEDIIKRYERGTYSFTWRVPEETRLEAGKKLREWAIAEHGSLTEERNFAWTLRPRIYERG